MRAAPALAALLVAGAALAGCGGSKDDGGAVDLPGGTAPLRPGASTSTAPPAGSSVLAATLKGADEVPGPGDPKGTGTARLVLQPNGQVCADLDVSGLDAAPTMAHVHRGRHGASGPVVVTLPTPGVDGRGSGCTPADPTLVAEIAGDPAGFYVNVHTTTHPAGAVRGDLAKG